MSRITPVPIAVPNVEAFGVGGVQPGSPTPSPSTPLTPTKCIYIRVLSMSRSGRRNSPRGDRQGLDFPSTENIRQAPDILPWGGSQTGGWSGGSRQIPTPSPLARDQRGSRKLGPLQSQPLPPAWACPLPHSPFTPWIYISYPRPAH